MEKNIKIFHWLPRIMCIFAILFISLFAADAFAPELTIRQQLAAFLIHLIPSFILIAILIVAWKWELLGGIIFTIIGLGLSPLVYIKNFQMNHSVSMSLGIIASITLPFIIVGILFIISHHFKKKYSNK